MEHSSTCLFHSECLRSVAGEASDLLFFAAIENKCSSASEIAIQLRHIADHLSAQELYQLHPDTQNLSKEVLRDLLQIYKWRATSTQANHSHLEKTPLQYYNDIIWQFKTEDSKAQLQQSITEFCKEPRLTIEPYRLRVRNLGNRLAKNEEQLKNNDEETNQYSHLRPLPVEVYPDQVHNLLVEGVRRYTRCIQPLHAPSRIKYHPTDYGHVTRLCLDSGYRSDDQLVLFNIITATSSMFYWQEMSISVQFQDSKTGAVQSQSKATFDVSELSLVECGDICRLLDSEDYAKLNFNLDTDLRLYKRPIPETLPNFISGCGVELRELLRTRELTVAHKIQLSHAIARAFWQFYKSERMSTNWTSDDIVFIPLDQKHSQRDGIPLRPFVSFPSGLHCRRAPKECDDEGQRTHKYRRILDLGITLLEIGLGYSLPVGDPTLSPTALVNTSHARALLRLRDLEDLVWDGFPWKGCFVQAVTHCLDPSHFNVVSRRQTDIKTIFEQLGIPDKRDIEYRRDVLYRKVVAPLSWLATAGFEKPEAVPQVPNRCSLRLQPTVSGDESIPSFCHKISTFPSLHCGSSDNSKGGDGTGEFLEGLKVLAGHIARCRRVAKATNQIRVAILDTGCKKDLSFFRTTQRSARLKGWKDFTPGESESEIDEFGHGTFMARLFLHVAPIVDVYLIRVAKNTTDLANSEENIAKAIEYAGLDPEWKVDVISMSFGFPYKPGKTCPVISGAIEEVTKVRNGSVLFLASAGNSWERGADFPARHEGVIPIYAADPSGRFLSSNPSHRGKGTDRLGTYGAGIPSFITDEIQKHFPTLDLRAGTSIATAIAAGIVSMTLSYASALPTLLGLKWAEKVCTKLHTKSGMEQMLLAMSLNVGDQNHFIHPVSFWNNKEEAGGFFASICAVVEQLNN